MRWSDIPLSPSARTLRQFAGLWIVFFAALAAWQGFGREKTSLGWVLLALALTVGPIGLIRPQLLRWLYVGWMIAVFPIGWVVSRVMLAVLFYGVFTPLGLAMRLAGRDVLQLRRPAGRTTYWVPKPAATDLRSYFRQF
jgi:saxitoxin biosynthesis operon SxtJ-like protein